MTVQALARVARVGGKEKEKEKAEKAKEHHTGAGMTEEAGAMKGQVPAGVAGRKEKGKVGKEWVPPTGDKPAQRAEDRGMTEQNPAQEEDEESSEWAQDTLGRHRRRHR